MKHARNTIYLLLGVSLTCHFLEGGKEVGIYSTIIIIFLLFFIDFIQKKERIEYIYPEIITKNKEQNASKKTNN